MNNLLIYAFIFFVVFVNGRFCKDPKDIIFDYFFFSRLNIPSNTNHALGLNVKPVFIDQLPRLNTLDISMARNDYVPFGINPLHIHPKGSEIIIALEGTILVGFVASNQNNHTFFYKILNWEMFSYF